MNPWATISPGRVQPCSLFSSQKMNKGDCLVYCIANAAASRTYVGWTNHWARRLRQHKGEIKGGAHSTRSYGPGAHPLFHVQGFKTQRHARQLEWLLHRRHGPGYARKRKESMMTWRLRRLGMAMKLERFTKDAPVTADAGLVTIIF